MGYLLLHVVVLEDGAWINVSEMLFCRMHWLCLTRTLSMECCSLSLC